MKADLLTKTEQVFFQKEGHFKLNIDTVLLAGYCRGMKAEKVLELGCGTGGALLMLQREIPEAVFTGVELDKEVCQCLEKTIKQNKISEKFRVINSDLREIKLKSEYDLVITNPPFEKSGKRSRNQFSSTARFEVSGTFTDFCTAAYKALKNRGRFVFIHKTERLCELLNAAESLRLPVKKIRFIHSFSDSSSNRFIAECRKNCSSGVEIVPPLFVRDRDCGYNKEVLGYYYDN